MAVDLSRRERCVPQELLDRAKVCAAFEQMGGESVSKLVGVREEAAQCRRVQRPPPRGKKESVLGATRKRGAGVREVPPDPVGRLFSERHGSFFLALSADENELLLEVDVGEVQVGRFLRSEAGRVDELEERAVSKGERAVAFEIAEKRLGFGAGRRAWEPPAALATERQLRHLLRAEGGAEECAHGGELAGDSRAGKLAGLPAGTIAAHLGRVTSECACVDLLERKSVLAKPR
jgi:hypothetical protein